MKKFTLSIIALIFFTSAFAQSTEAVKRYAFKKATITYKLGGDFDGTRTIYIDDYGAKQAEYWEGTYEKRQPGPNERVAFKFHTIYDGKLMYHINDMDYFSMISTNPYYFYAQGIDDTKEANEAILVGLGYEKTDKKEQINGEECTMWVQHLRFIIRADNYAWFDDKYIETKFQFSFLIPLQLMCDVSTATLDKIDYNAEIPASAFTDFPEYYLYQYAESRDVHGNSFDDQVFASDEEKQKFEDDLKLKAFVPSRDIDEETYQKNLQAFSDQYIGDKVYAGFDNENGYINTQFQITEGTDSTEGVSVVIDIRNRTRLDKLYLDNYKRSFNDFKTTELTPFDLDGRKAIYIAGLKGEEEPLSVIAFNDKDKYSVQFTLYGKYTQDEIIELLKQTKILDL